MTANEVFKLAKETYPKGCVVMFYVTLTPEGFFKFVNTVMIDVDDEPLSINIILRFMSKPEFYCWSCEMFKSAKFTYN